MRTREITHLCATLGIGLALALGSAACDEQGFEQAASQERETSQDALESQLLYLEDENGGLYELEYVSVLSPDELAAVLDFTVSLDGSDVQAQLDPIVDDRIDPERVQAPDSIEIVELRPAQSRSEADDVEQALQGLSVSGFKKGSITASPTIGSSGGWYSTCFSVKGMIASMAVLDPPSSGKWTLYLYSNSTCTSVVSSVTSPSTGRMAATQSLSSSGSLTRGYKVKSSSGSGTGSLIIGYDYYY